MHNLLNYSYLIFLNLFIFSNSLAQGNNEEIFKKIVATKLPAEKGKRLETVAKLFLGKPYMAHTLETNKSEALVINLKEFDCSTLVETAIAICNLQDNSYKSFKNNLLSIRYYKGKLTDYGSRLHYLTDWLLDNSEKGLISLETKNIGGKPYQKEVYFMSKNLGKYPSANTEAIKQQISMAEERINEANFYYIPKSDIAQYESKIKTGDIIAITTSIQGLDCSHQGIAVLKNGRIHLLHASLTKKKVIISTEPLINYINKNSKQTGIMVARLQN